MEKNEGDQGTGLKEFILSEIESKGPMPFSRFMEYCLYHPEKGYYQTDYGRIGKDGDYYTSPCVHPLFGYLLAKQFQQMSEILEGEGFDVVEMGCGRGLLCGDILHWAKERAPSFYQDLRYTLVETAPAFLREQKKRLAEEEKAGKVFWMESGEFSDQPREESPGESPGEWPGESPGESDERNDSFEGCFLSNELVDAFPVHRMMVDQGRLKELYITQKKGSFEEEWRESSDPRLASYFESMGVSLQEGQKAEVNLKALEWMERVGRYLKRGFVLTIDYGFMADDLYGPHRPEGTLLGYHRHQVSENPYERIGEQDLTSHVNFTGLIRKGEEVGLHFAGLVPQYRFLIGLGFIEEMQALEEGLSDSDALRLRLSLKHLIDPEAGMGEAFKVLIQYKGIENPVLDGLREFHSMGISA